jgi:recombination DNA repair RAD52 pathway protein
MKRIVKICESLFVSPRDGSALSDNKYSVRFEVYTAVTMKNGVFWDVTSCGSCKNRRVGGTQRLHHQGDKIQ